MSGTTAPGAVVERSARWILLVPLAAACFIEAGLVVALFGAVRDGGFVVDWKTSRHENADPLQLALYRLAWAELTGVPLDRVRAAFHYVRTGRTVEPDDLSGRQQLEELVSAAPQEVRPVLP